MRRTLLWSLLTACAVLVVSVFVVMLRADDATGPPPPDPHLTIQLQDGSTLPLAELLARLKDTVRAPVEPLLAADAAGDVNRAPRDARAGMTAGLVAPPYPGMSWGPVFRLAEHHRQGARLDQALALYLSIPEGDPDYGHAQRRIAWDILTLGHDDPAAGVAYTHRALAAEPLDGNSWQDLVRVYGRTLGLPLD
jgi:hypothetical protein